MSAAPGLDHDERFEVRVTADSHFAWVRTRLAVERTMMAYMRTATSLIAFGFTIFQFMDRLQSGRDDVRCPEAPWYLGLALILCGIAAGSALPVLWPGTGGLVASALVFGACVFQAPAAVTNFTRQNLPQQAWGRAIGLFTVVFAVAQTIGPWAAGVLGDLSGSIGTSLLAASGVLLAGAALAALQRRL